MPYKHNDSRRHKFTKPKYKVTNWPECSDAMRPKMARQKYKFLLCEPQVFHMALRQTEGFMNLVARLMKARISIPDFSRISKRSIELPRHVLSKAQGPGNLVVVDSTELKVYGKDEWR